MPLPPSSGRAAKATVRAGSDLAVGGTATSTVAASASTTAGATAAAPGSSRAGSCFETVVAAHASHNRLCNLLARSFLPERRRCGKRPWDVALRIGRLKLSGQIVATCLVYRSLIPKSPEGK